MKTSIKLVFLFVLVICTVTGVNAQSCRGSYLTYLVRDAKGKILANPNSHGVTFAGGTSDASKKWRFSIKGEFVNAALKLPTAIAAIAGDVTGMTTSQFCNFPEPVTLKLTMNAKTMELTFKFPKFGEQESLDFVVDSLPFKSGKYQITLAKPKGTYGAYFAATGWKAVK
ncbi:hypothetical protein BH10ACI3_BH10ACI3_14880 [soil metagenome]